MLNKYFTCHHLLFSKKKCTLAAVVFLLMSCNSAFSQTLVNSTGNTIQNNTISVEYSIGEIGITTLAGGENYVTQGLLQPILNIKSCSMLQLIPNAFTPDNNGLNDCFGVKNWPATLNFALSIYNRWGQLVFQTTSVTACWNGEYNGKPQPGGAYVYIINANTTQCGKRTIKGTVVLIR